MGLALIIILPRAQILWSNDSNGEKEKLGHLAAQVMQYRQENPRKAIEYGQQALKILQDHPDDISKVKVLNGLCWAYCIEGQYREALSSGKEAETIATKIGAKKELAIAFGSLANVYLDLSDFHKALYYSMKAKSVSEDIGYKQATVSALVSIARIQRNLMEYEKALANYQMAMTISEELGDKHNVAWILNNTATVHWNLKQYQKALDIYFRALETMKEVKSEMGYALVSNNIACVYCDIGKYDQALEYDLESLEIYEKAGNKVYMAYSFKNIGKDYGNLGDYARGLRYLDKSFEMAVQMGIKDLVKTIYEEYTRLYETMGNYKLSLFYYKKLKETGDEILNQDINQRIAHLEVVYDVEKKEKENQLLKEKNHLQALDLSHQKLLGNFLIVVTFLVIIIAIITFNRYRIKKKTARALKISEEKLQKMNDTKDKLFTIIAHDLGNPLNNLLLNSGHLHRNLRQLGEKNIEESVQDIYRQTQGLTNLLENLLQWAMVQTGRIERCPEILDIRAIVDETIHLAKYSAQKKEITLVSNVLEDTAAWADKHMIKTVVRNLVSNALKYTRPGGEVVITSRERDGYVEITVSDNGVGMDEEKRRLLLSGEIQKSTRGTIDEKGTGLGLVLCKEFVESNGGEIRVQSWLDQGSHFSFTVPRRQ
ncbi:MAG: putative UDP-N-acetylglucosamine--peptide N-acetylglucosaminyltransferase [Acidobacteriota bacterium]|nr:putative UDP-N-acetylglucosamine--peptide N-acetylglucosaminyltransferase [Acidobacteriota bacterium]